MTMATETPKCEKCGQYSRRIGISKQKGKMVAHLACSACGHGFTVKLAGWRPRRWEWDPRLRHPGVTGWPSPSRWLRLAWCWQHPRRLPGSMFS